MTDPDPAAPHPAGTPADPDLEKLASILRELRDCLLTASLALKDHLADTESGQSQQARAEAQDLIAHVRSHANDFPPSRAPRD